MESDEQGGKNYGVVLSQAGAHVFICERPFLNGKGLYQAVGIDGGDCRYVGYWQPDPDAPSGFDEDVYFVTAL